MVSLKPAILIAIVMQIQLKWQEPHECVFDQSGAPKLPLNEMPTGLSSTSLLWDYINSFMTYSLSITGGSGNVHALVCLNCGRLEGRLVNRSLVGRQAAARVRPAHRTVAGGRGTWRVGFQHMHGNDWQSLQLEVSQGCQLSWAPPYIVEKAVVGPILELDML